jgi:hypothetical protein
MINKFLGRLQNEDHIGYLVQYDRNLETRGGQKYSINSETGETLLGEQFFFAFETDEFNTLETAVGQTHIDVTLPMEIVTSSPLEFKVGDKIVFYERIKFITGVSTVFTRDDITIGIGFNPKVQRYYTRLTLS